MNINSNTHSQAGAWERGRSPVGRIAPQALPLVALIPTIIRIKHICYRSIRILYANISLNIKHLMVACLCRDRDNPTYGCTNNYFKTDLIRIEI